ncbi:MAG: NUDIX hydrolase [Crocinitomicaceae bacterium]|nr:NUDIX hydrolase [Crocinitomicaceae bacterium]MBK8926261.1 NUDIX hydrolase [Crocinitomicaceae bacterium]
MKISQNIKVAVDAIVFGYSENDLKVLLIKQKFGKLKNQWALAGGFVKNNEALRDAVVRELYEEAGIKVNYLEQLYTFGDQINRDPRARVISVAYFALVNSDQLFPVADTDAKEAAWYSLKKLPKLAFDHRAMIQTAVLRLQNKLTYQPIGFDLLPKEFLFSDLENLYSTILEKEIDRRNFRKKIMSYGIIEETPRYSQRKSGRPAKLFRFNKSKYTKLVQSGFYFEIHFA